jgi:FkbM family methyltransferase
MSFCTDQVDIVKRLGHPWYNVVDIGAFKGNTVAEYRKLLPSSRVYAYDPLPSSVEMLTERFKSDPHVHIYPFAVADKRGEQTIYLGGAKGSHSSLYPRPSSGRRYYLSNLRPDITVKTVDLDTHLHELGVGHVNIMKVDVHGAFPAIVRGAHKLLTGQKIDVIGIEVYFVEMYRRNPLFHEICTLLEGYAYGFYGVCDFLRDQENGQFTVGNAIFVSERIRAEVLDKMEEGWKPRGDNG